MESIHQHWFGAITRDAHTVWLCCACRENAATYQDGGCLLCDTCYGERMIERLNP